MTISIQQYRVSISHQFKYQLITCKKSNHKKIPKYFLFILFLVMSPIFINNMTTNNQNSKIIKNNNHKIRDDISCHVMKYFSSKYHNKLMRTINGNINKLNIMQYNKGNSIYQNKDHFLNNIIYDKKIDIACISEANLRESYKNSNNLLIGYQCESKLMSDQVDISRNIILINQHIPYKRRVDLEDKYIATI